MIYSTTKKVILFISIGIFYILLTLFGRKYTYDLSNNNGKFVLILCAIIISLATLGLYEGIGVQNGECYDYNTKNLDMKTNDPNYQTLGEFNADSVPGASCNNLNITPSKLCMGGSYLSQGGTERGKMCQQLASTPEGLDAIGSSQCSPPGLFVGMPGGKFQYTPVSNSIWANDRCNPPASTDTNNNSFLGV